jgi:hypothetical protein
MLTMAAGRDQQFAFSACSRRLDELYVLVFVRLLPTKARDLFSLLFPFQASRPSSSFHIQITFHAFWLRKERFSMKTVVLFQGFLFAVCAFSLSNSLPVWKLFY